MNTAGAGCVYAAGYVGAVEGALTAMGAKDAKLLGAVTGRVVSIGVFWTIGAVWGMVTVTGFYGTRLLMVVTYRGITGLGVSGLLRACNSLRRR